MGDMALWEKLLLGVFAVGIIFLFRPGIKETFKRSKEAKSDWAGVLFPLGIMVLFVMGMIWYAKNG